MTILVIDIGSSSARALLFNDEAEPIPDASASLIYRMDTSPQGASVIDVKTLQITVEACIDTVLEHPAAQKIDVVAMASFAGNVLGVAATDNKPLTPVFTYADTRCSAEVDYLASKLDKSAIHQRTGCLLHTSYLPGRLLWLRRQQPVLFDKVGRWMDFGTYLYSQWFDNPDIPCSYSIASWSGLLNRHDCAWDRELLDSIGLREEALPRLVDYDTVQQALSWDYAERWPRLRNVPFCLVVGDGAAANVGAGCLDQEHLALSVGTTAALRLAAEDSLPQVAPGLWSYRVTKDIHVTGGATSEGGNIFGWAQSVLQLNAPDLVEEQLLSREADAHGLTFLPLLLGERSPGWRPDATGTIHGLRLNTTPMDILQAALEGVALRLAVIGEQLSDITQCEPQIIGGGGGIKNSPGWSQIIANALGHPLYITDELEITARGAALLGMKALGRDMMKAPPRITGVFEPHPARVERLREARERQEALYRALYD